MTDKVDFLAQLPIFEDLDLNELEALAKICTEYEFEDKAVIAYQRDVADSMYIVRSGRLFARSMDGYSRVRETNAYLPGDYFGDQWLFTSEAHPATVNGSGQGRLLVIKGSDFLTFLDKNKRALNKMAPVYDGSDVHIGGMSEQAWNEAQKVLKRAHKQSTAVSLLPDELVEYLSRRSRWFLFLTAILPLTFFFVFAVILFLLLANTAEGSIWQRVSILLPAMVLLLGILYALFRALDWSNDYFVITNKHLTHREFNLRNFRSAVNKIPIDQIQSVEIIKPSLFANLFNIGTARITTGAQVGVIYFDNIDNPLEVKDILNRLGLRVKALDAGREQAVMRRSLESHFQVKPSMEAVKETADGAASTAPTVRPKSFGQRFHERYGSRIEEGDTITYRKHFYILLQHIAWPAAALLLIGLSDMILSTFFELSLLTTILIVLVLGSVNIAWLIWQMEDWRNDTFQVTDRFVIDIDRRPFGFGETRKQADLGNVQNVNADTPGFLATLFNFGNVVVETAGAKSDIVFQDVVNPSQVQSDIFKRRDAIQQKQRVNEGERRRKEYAVLLDVYKQAEEQGRLPRRTPTDLTIEAHLDQHHQSNETS